MVVTQLEQEMEWDFWNGLGLGVVMQSGGKGGNVDDQTYRSNISRYTPSCQLLPTTTRWGWDGGFCDPDDGPIHLPPGNDARERERIEKEETRRGSYGWICLHPGSVK